MSVAKTSFVSQMQLVGLACRGSCGIKCLTMFSGAIQDCGLSGGCRYLQPDFQLVIGMYIGIN